MSAFMLAYLALAGVSGQTDSSRSSNGGVQLAHPQGSVT